MAQNRTKAIVATATLGLLVACGSAAMLPVTQLFGPTMAAALALGPTDEPLSSTEIAGLSTDRPLSLTTDPIDL